MAELDAQLLEGKHVKARARIRPANGVSLRMDFDLEAVDSSTVPVVTSSDGALHLQISSPTSEIDSGDY